MYRLVHALTPADRPRLLAHFKALDENDRWLRFSANLPDDMLADYVDGIDFERDLVFGAFNVAFELVAVAHVGIREGTAEIGLSVLVGYRREGLARRLIERARRSAVARGCHRLWIHFMRDNDAMASLTRSLGMESRAAHGECDAYLALPQASPLALRFALCETQVDSLLGALRHWVPHAA